MDKHYVFKITVGMAKSISLNFEPFLGNKEDLITTILKSCLFEAWSLNSNFTRSRSVILGLLVIALLQKNGLFSYSK